MARRGEVVKVTPASGSLAGCVLEATTTKRYPGTNIIDAHVIVPQDMPLNQDGVRVNAALVQEEYPNLQFDLHRLNCADVEEEEADTPFWGAYRHVFVHLERGIDGS